MAKPNKQKQNSRDDKRDDKAEAKIFVKEPLPVIKPGMTVKVHERITEKGPKGDKTRIQIFEGIILGHKHGKEAGATITVRKISDGIAVEKIFPINSPIIEKIEPVKQAKVTKAKLHYLRSYKKRLKETRLDK